MPDAAYPGPERRKFRRVGLRYPLHLEAVSSSAKRDAGVSDGVTVNLSYGGALVALPAAQVWAGAMPVTIRFGDAGRIVPSELPGVVWRPGAQTDEDLIAVEFEVPLLSYDGATELAERLVWLRETGGEEFLVNLLDGFLDQAPEIIRLAKERQLAADLAAVAQVLGTLKSGAGTIGAVSLYEIVRRAEHAAGAGDERASARYVDLLDRYFLAVKDELEKAI